MRIIIVWPVDEATPRSLEMYHSGGEFIYNQQSTWYSPASEQQRTNILRKPPYGSDISQLFLWTRILLVWSQLWLQNLRRWVIPANDSRKIWCDCPGKTTCGAGGKRSRSNGPAGGMTSIERLELHWASHSHPDPPNAQIWTLTYRVDHVDTCWLFIYSPFPKNAFTSPVHRKATLDSRRDFLARDASLHKRMTNHFIPSHFPLPDGDRHQFTI